MREENFFVIILMIINTTLDTEKVPKVIEMCKFSRNFQEIVLLFFSSQ